MSTPTPVPHPPSQPTQPAPAEPTAPNPAEPTVPAPSEPTIPLAPETQPVPGSETGSADLNADNAVEQDVIDAVDPGGQPD